MEVFRKITKEESKRPESTVQKLLKPSASLLLPNNFNYGKTCDIIPEVFLTKHSHGMCLQANVLKNIHVLYCIFKPYKRYIYILLMKTLGLKRSEFTNSCC